MTESTNIQISQPTLAELAAKLGTTEEAILSHCRLVELVDARSMIVALLMERPCVRQQDVAPLLGISQAAVSKLLARHRQMLNYSFSSYKDRWQALKKELNESCCNNHITDFTNLNKKVENERDFI